MGAVVSRSLGSQAVHVDGMCAINFGEVADVGRLTLIGQCIGAMSFSGEGNCERSELQDCVPTSYDLPSGGAIISVPTSERGPVFVPTLVPIRETEHV